MVSHTPYVHLQTVFLWHLANASITILPNSY